MPYTKEKNVVYVLHKSGAKNHYSGLKQFCGKNEIKLVFREFSILSTFFKSLLKLNFKLVFKQILNAFFLLQLTFSRNKKIVLGIAPFDYKLKNLMCVLKNHQIYYHTSWTCWDGSFHPKKKKITPEIMRIWKEMIEKNSRHIFAVSQKTKNELLKNYELNESKISVVYHSLNEKHFNKNQSTQNQYKTLNFIYVGRLIPAKGIEELLIYFSENQDKVFTIVGKGDLQNKAEEFSKQFPNIRYLGEIRNPEKLAIEFGKNHYLVLNSKKSEKWEELFGMVLIEAMACGAVPVATDHPGPKEIVQHGKNGFLVEENQMIGFLNGLAFENNSEEIKNQAIKTAENFGLKKISERWFPILEN